MKIYVVYYDTENGKTMLEKAFIDKMKAVNYCDKQQKEANNLNEDKNYFFNSMTLED